MKQKLVKLPIIVIALFSVMLFVFSIVKSSIYTAPIKAPVTQQSIQKKLYASSHVVASPKTRHNEKKATAAARPTTAQAVAQQITSTPTQFVPSVSDTTGSLTNTGPGNMVLLFILTTIAATTASYAYILKSKLGRS